MANLVEIKVPDIGDFKNVDVIDVMVKPGDTVAVDTPLITIETDKAAMDVPSTAAGVVRDVKVKVGSKVSEGTPILVLEVEERAAAARSAADVEEKKATAVAAHSVPSVSPATEHGFAPPPIVSLVAPAPGAATPAPRVDEAGFTKAHAGPAVRKFARELGVDLARVTGSGVKGRITFDDVKAYVKSVMQGGAFAAAGSALPAVPQVDYAKFGEIEVKPLNRIKRISGPRLHASWVNVPHVTQHDEADITDLENLRKALKTDAEKIGAKLTPLAFIIKAVVQALREYPDFNSSLDASGQNLVYRKYFHIGFAVDTPNGLVVPVIRDADRKNVFELAKELGELSQKAREGKLTATDMQGGCFSISSLGSIGGTAFTPIVNAPEVAILGVSKAQMKPVWNGNAFVPRLMLPLSLSYDHRVIDGAAAARFTRFLGEVLAEVRGLVL
ncbi:MAG TPA: dihydrolipoyllysine-residue acetyltransferase [Gammaproteobacteria bacterium]|nr:dihydrolipoyllysine-residue acetyltransferase [Gammaproteobacteria bacterium]